MEKVDALLAILAQTPDGKGLPEEYIFDLETELKGYFVKIRDCRTFQDADDGLTRLGLYQEKLARLSSKYHVPLSCKLNEFVREYDRCDDEDVRRRLFNQIRSEEQF